MLSDMGFGFALPLTGLVILCVCLWALVLVCAFNGIGAHIRMCIL